MRRICLIGACIALLGSLATGRQITGKTNVGGFGSSRAVLKLSTELLFPGADNSLTAGERAAIRVDVTNEGGSAATDVVLKVTAAPALQGVTIQSLFELGTIAKGASKSAIVEIASEKNARSQRSLIELQASTPSGIVSERRPINMTLREQAAPAVVVARDIIPPTIEILEPVRVASRGLKILGELPNQTTNASSVTIKGIARDSSGVALVFINGEEATLTSIPGGAEFSGTALLAMGKNELEVKAFDRFKNEAKLVLHVQREEQMIQGGYYALVIAVQDYLDPSVNALQYPIQDSENLVNALTTLYTFDPSNITLLKNPTRTAIIKTFDQLARKLTERDNLLIFYAGHGYWDERLKQGYWLPVDAAQNTRTEWISNGTIRDYVAGMASKHTLLISDACFSGGIFKTRDAFSAESPATLELYKLPSRKAMTSGAMKEVPDKSVFVEYLIKRLKDNKEKLLPAETLFASFRQAVINNSPNRQVPQYGEIRETGDEGGDFIFVKK